MFACPNIRTILNKSHFFIKANLRKHEQRVCVSTIDTDDLTKTERKLQILYDL